MVLSVTSSEHCLESPSGRWLTVPALRDSDQLLAVPSPSSCSRRILWSPWQWYLGSGLLSGMKLSWESD